MRFEKMSTFSKVKTRFAPSPTGYLHVGGARTALFNYLYAKAKGGEFLLRIEDTDQERSNEESYQLMIESMRWLGLDWDEGPGKEKELGPYKQSQRLSIYQKKIAQLLKEKKVYRCFCTSEELEAKKKQREAMGLPPLYDGKCKNLTDDEIEKKLEEKASYTYRFATPNTQVIVHDLVQGEVHFDTSLIGDFIIVKSDGYPSYNFAVVVDDHLMEISHVIRGVGHLSNTPRQILLYQAFGWAQPFWAHVSEIVGSDHKKLSKRHGATAITAFRDLGYSPEAFSNYMSLLGWSPADGKEFMKMSKLSSQFDVSRCNKSPAMFDVFDMNLVGDAQLNSLATKDLEKYLFPKSKLNWLSNLHIREKSEEQYLQEVFPFIEQYGNLPSEVLSKEKERVLAVASSLRVYLDSYYQIHHYIGDFFSSFDISDSAKHWLAQPFAFDLVQYFYDATLASDDWSETTIASLIKESGKATSVKGKNLFMTLRSAVTGKTQGLEMPIYLSLLGKERVGQRLQHSLEIIKNAGS